MIIFGIVNIIGDVTSRHIWWTRNHPVLNHPVRKSKTPDIEEKEQSTFVQRLVQMLPMLAGFAIAFIYPLAVLPSYFASSTSTRVLLVLLVHPIVLESLEAFGRSSGADESFELQQQRDIPMEKVERAAVQGQIKSFCLKQLMALFRRFMLLNVSPRSFLGVA